MNAFQEHRTLSELPISKAPARLLLTTHLRTLQEHLQEPFREVCFCMTPLLCNAPGSQVLAGDSDHAL